MMMEIGKPHIYPDRNLLKKIVSGKQLKVVSPFYSAESLALIMPNKIDRVSFITRLPTQYIMPSAFIENNPMALIKLQEKMGSRMKIYALPELHAKLFINDKHAWVGSSNFTMNGFSGKPEIVIQFEEENNGRWSEIFDTYAGKSILVKRSDLNKLSKWMSSGLTKVRKHHQVEEQSKNPPLTFEDFVEWLSDNGQPKHEIRRHIHARIRGKNYMSGHVPPAFNGVVSFLHTNRAHIARLEEIGDREIPEFILKDFASFIKNNGDQYRGSRGGYWRNYLSVRLGGKQKGGGAGDTIAKKCLVLIPSYLRARGQLDFE